MQLRILRGKKSLVCFLTALFLATLLGAGASADVQHPILTVQRFYRALIAQDYPSAMQGMTGTIDPTTAAERFRDLVTSDWIVGPVGMKWKKRKIDGCIYNLKNIGTAAEMYSIDYSGRYPKKLSLLTPNYIRTIPTCPAARKDTYSSSYRAATRPDACTFFCKGSHHAKSGYATDYPQYNSTTGVVRGEVSRGSSEGEEARWTVEDFRILGHSVKDDAAMVAVEETYAVSGFRTSVRIEYPLRRVESRWLIDAAKLADGCPPPFDREHAVEVLLWLKSRGAGIAAALCRSGGVESIPRMNEEEGL